MHLCLQDWDPRVHFCSYLWDRLLHSLTIKLESEKQTRERWPYDSPFDQGDSSCSVREHTYDARQEDLFAQKGAAQQAVPNAIAVKSFLAPKFAEMVHFCEIGLYLPCVSPIRAAGGNPSSGSGFGRRP